MRLQQNNLSLIVWKAFKNILKLLLQMVFIKFMKFLVFTESHYKFILTRH